ncbi:hypothetical protein IJD44_00975 [bacterium]|nr:hypothetical protein [bacterium]
MRIISEITGKEYESVEECLCDERAFEAQKAEEKRIAEEKAKNRAQRAKEIDEAYKHWRALVKDFCKDFGGYHTTISSKDFFDMFPFWN